MGLGRTGKALGTVEGTVAVAKVLPWLQLSEKEPAGAWDSMIPLSSSFPHRRIVVAPYPPSVFAFSAPLSPVINI